MNKTTKIHLSNALFLGATLRIGNQRLVKVLSVQHEDGSGKRFNVEGFNAYGMRVTMFVTTTD